MDKIARRSIWTKGSDHFIFIDALVIASCYKLVSMFHKTTNKNHLNPFDLHEQNTTESFSYAEYLWIEASGSGCLKKTAAFMVAFAYKQHKLAQALHIANKYPGDSAIEQIKLLALIELECFDEIIECISLWSRDERFSKVQISKDVVCSTPSSNHIKLSADFVYLFLVAA